MLKLPTAVVFQGLPGGNATAMEDSTTSLTTTVSGGVLQWTGLPERGDATWVTTMALPAVKVTISEMGFLFVALGMTALVVKFTAAPTTPLAITIALRRRTTARAITLAAPATTATATRLMMCITKAAFAVAQRPPAARPTFTTPISPTAL